MKNLTLTLLFLGLFSGLSAQYVTIPDVNFRNELLRLYPNCFNANQEMDTTCSAVVNETRLVIVIQPFYNFEGIQYFDGLDSLVYASASLVASPILPHNLKYLMLFESSPFPNLPNGLEELYCSNSYVSSLPNILPNSLRIIECASNYLASLPNLPSSLQTLDCGGNQLTSLPALPSSLRLLRCDNNQLTNLPALPSGLQTLSCSYNQLTNLPALPSGITGNFDCSNNQLTSLPALPSGMTGSLLCQDNQLTSLPALPSGMTGSLWCQDNQLTSLPALPSGMTGSLWCQDNQLTSLPALPSGMTGSLYCQNNQLTSLPTLPSGLIGHLYCQNNQLMSLPALPSGLNGNNFNCSNNQLTSLPALPNAFYEFYCAGNQLTSLPALPLYVSFFDCSNNRLTSLPALPLGMFYFSCGGNQLTSLPILPPMESFDCGNNQLTSLPALPNMRAMACQNNQLTSLPALPNGLETLYCLDNQLTSLPALPNSLGILDCSFNQLTSLPALPNSLGGLLCSNNVNLACLPLLPYSLNGLGVTSTAISCIPNYTGNITQQNALLPLCANPSQICQVSPMARGAVYNDANSNGVKDIGESLTSGMPILINPNAWTSISDSTNGYLVKLDTLPIINIIRPGYAVPYRIFSPSSYTVTTTSLGMLPDTFNFGIITQPNVTDLVTHINTWFIRPGFQTSASVNVENIGTIDQTNASISLEIPNGLTVITVTPANGVVTGNTVTWSGENIGIFERKNYWVSLQVPPTMPLGTSLTYTAQATPATTDFTPADNIVTEMVVVRGSYDPNDKQVNKDRLPNNYVAADEEMLYTIRFQNTGTDTAFTVLVRDTLDLQKLDFSTFRVTGASHALRTNVRDHGVLEFVFNNINLPDSFVNEPLSHGYVQFRIHPKANLPLGTQIKNRAFIYFDFNTPIITNFATTTVGLLSVSSAELGAGSLSLYPVPVAEQLTVNFNALRSGEVRYRLLDLQGRLLQEQQLTVTEGENISTMDMSRLGAGMYLLQVVGEQGSVSSKIVKK